MRKGPNRFTLPRDAPVVALTQGACLLANSLLSRLMPREDRFYAQLDGIARKVTEGGTAFARFRDVTSPDEFLHIADELRVIEHDCDKMVHVFYNELDATFVTPIDREDLHDLCSSLDTILDSMEECAGFIVNYRLKELTPPMRELIRIAQASCEEVAVVISLLRDRGKLADLNAHLIRVHSLENEGDTVFRLALGDLFQTQTNAIELIRQKDIIEALEGTIDAADDVGDLVRSISMKNA